LGRAIAETGKTRLTGFVAWLAWLFIHVCYLVGFKNRFGVFLTWVWSYLFSTCGARLITEREWRLDPRAAASRTPLGAPTAGPKTPVEGTTTGTRGTEADRLGPSWT
jgi:NADH dehydrogenase